MRRRFVWFLTGVFWLVFCTVTQAEKIGDLSRVLRPFTMTMGEGRLYITEEQPAVHVFGLADGLESVEYVKTFGREGKGPGEFGFIHQIRIRDGQLEIPTFGKYARYSLDGNLIDEHKLPIQVFKGGISRIGNRYVARDIDFRPDTIKTRIILYDRNFKQLGSLGDHTREKGFDRLELVADYFSARVYQNRIYVIKSGQETILTVYDTEGKQVDRFLLPLERVKVTSAFRERITAPIKKDFERQGYNWDQWKDRLYFPKYTPGLNFFGVQDGKIIARTYVKQKEMARFVVFDLTGTVLTEIFLYDTGRASEGTPFFFHRGFYFYLKENAGAEVWELHREKIL